MQETKKKTKKPSSFYRRQDRWGLLMMTPWLIGVRSEEHTSELQSQ